MRTIGWASALEPFNRYRSRLPPSLAADPIPLTSCRLVGPEQQTSPHPRGRLEASLERLRRGMHCTRSRSSAGLTRRYRLACRYAAVGSAKGLIQQGKVTPLCACRQASAQTNCASLPHANVPPCARRYQKRIQPLRFRELAGVPTIIRSTTSWPRDAWASALLPLRTKSSGKAS